CAALAAAALAPSPSPLRSAGPAAGAVEGAVRVREHGLFGASDKSDRSGVVVYLAGVPGEPPARPRAPAELRQRERRFLPPVLAVRVGDPVTFPNDDKVFHNVFSLSQPAKFDLGLYKSGETRTV